MESAARRRWPWRRLLSVAALAAATAAIFTAAAVIAVAIIPAPHYKSWAYHYFGGDYYKFGWIYDGVIDRDRPIGDLFIGSSHIFVAVDDGMIAGAMPGPAPYNAGISYLGRNAEYVLLRDIAGRNKPRRLFLEVHETEDRIGHIGFPVIGDIGDVATSPANPWWASDLLSMLQHRLAYIGAGEPIVQPRPAPVFGVVKHETSAPRGQLSADAEWIRRNRHLRYLPAMFGDLEFRANEQYVEAMAALCRENHIELHFLYIPGVDAPREPAQAAFYRGLGTLHLMPDALRSNLDYWSDYAHLNAKGTAFYTRWLLTDVLRKPLRQNG